MSDRRPSICLSMIVKNETPVIARCLNSLRPLIDHWIVVDTGSSDGTQDLVRSTLADVPGSLHERPWVDFAHNRNQALELAAAHGDYLFVIDADETLEWPDGYALPDLGADAYSLQMHYHELIYRRVCLIRAERGWRYRGVLHEYLDSGPGASILPLDGPIVRIRPEGARSRNPRKFHEDAALLEKALQSEPDNARYRFYLAQSYRDAGETELALQHYRRRREMGGWEEEVWYSALQMAVMLERLQAPATEVAQAYLAAYQLRPSRAETLVELARYHRLRQEFALALVYARAAALIPMPADQLFIDAASYQWRALDELAVAAWWCGALAEGAAAQDKLVREQQFPEAERARVEANTGFYAGAGFAIG